MGYLSEGGGLSSAPTSSSTTTRTTTGSNTQDTSTTSRTNTSAGSTASVLAASPTTSVSSHTAGSDTNNLSGAQTGNRSNQQSSGIAAAANIAGGALSSGSSGASTGNRSDPVDRSPSMNWNQFDDMVNGSPTRSMAQIARDASFDPVNRTPSHNWLQLQDMLDAMTPAKSKALEQLSVPGMGLNWNDFVQNVQNGSLGVPRAAGYGKTYDPNAPPAAYADNTLLMGPAAAEDPYSAAHGIQAALGSVHLPTGAQVYDFLQAPYKRRVMRENAGLADGVLGGFSSMAPNGTITDASAPSTRVVPTTVVAPAYAEPSTVNGVSPLDVGKLGLTTDLFAGNDGTAAIDAAAPRMTADGILLPRPDPRGYASDFPVDSSVPLNLPAGAPAQITVHGGKDTSTAPAGDKPSMWDGIVDNTGKLLSHTGLGAIVSGMFPDLWDNMGNAFKGLDNGGPGTAGPVTPYSPASDNEIADRQNSRSGGPLDFLDLNQNGIDDRLEGVPATGIAALAPPDTDATGYSGNQFRSNRYATFPDMPPYRPGVDDEWDYFHDHLARGGVVGYAGGGRVDKPDPRVMMIADAEDALHRGDHQHNSIAKFVDTFGPKALENLNNNVLAGYRMRAGRTVVGPGGPTNDAVPAVIDGQHPAKLSSGEFVVPVAAVEGIGGGDPRVGAQRLHDLVSRFSAK